VLVQLDHAGAIDRDEYSFGEVCRPPPLEPTLLQVEEPVLARKRRGTTEEHHSVLAELTQCEPRREQ
jgi:hypothetical protein